MNPKEKIQKEIEGLRGLLQQSLRIGNPKYQRMIRGDIEKLERDLRIQKVKEQKVYFDKNTIIPK
jgi:hypothetical protein